MELENFSVVKAAMTRDQKRPFSLLLGNGFSMAYAPSIFSYNALHNFVDKTDNAILKALFGVVDTHDFERVMQQLDLLESLGEVLALGGELKQRISVAREDLKRSLIDAVRALHPEHVYKVPEEKCAACKGFLQLFLDSRGSLFTTNYDLLLYWVLMRSGLLAVDGFGRDRESSDEYVRPELLGYSELRWGRNAAGQNVHYVHGALPLFDTGTEVVKEQYQGVEGYLIDRITERIKNGQYPIFVTAGSADQKLTHIRHNPYLLHSYDALANLDGSLVTFGFNFGQQDAHIVAAIKRAAKQPASRRLRSVYIGVYSHDDAERLAQVGKQFKCKVHLYDAKTAEVWG